MAGMREFRRRRVGGAKWTVMVGVALWAAACTGDSGGEASYDVTRELVSHETTQEILVFAPDAEGSWPTVIALHGLDGSAEDVAETSRRLAERGFVVFAPTYRTDMSSEQGAMNASRDLICAGWYADSIAEDHGGDPESPLTLLGWSLGAGYVLEGALIEDLDPAGDLLPCSVASLETDVVVAVAGCHYGFGDAEFDFDVSGWSNHDTTVVLAVGEDDVHCEPWQSEDASEELRSHGYDVDYVVFEDADHFSPFYLDFVDGGLVLDPDHPAGDQLVDIVADAVEAAGSGTS